MRYVGNVHAHLDVAVGQAAVRERIVEVLCIGRVDGKGYHLAHVAALGYFGRGNIIWNLLGGLGYLLWEVVGQAVVGQDGVHLGFVVAGTTQHLHDLADGVLSRLGNLGYLNDHLIAILRLAGAAHRHEDIERHLLTVGHHKDVVGRHLHRAHVLALALLEDLHDLALGALLTLVREDEDAHLVAVQRLVHVVGGDKHILL